MRLAGYVIQGAEPGPGTGYTYVLAGNGLFLESQNHLLAARILVAPALVRGLPALDPLLELKHGPIPGHLLALATDVMAARPDQEMYAAIIWDGANYSLRLPEQEADVGHVTYQVVPGTVADLHSHGRMGAFFSPQDDRDDQGLVVSVVLGHLDELMPQAMARLCVYGYFSPVSLAEVFDRVPSGLDDAWSI
ncbi:MAG: Mov34/MPN/PAD-1 family protein [Chloroflexota bacterium]